MRMPVRGLISTSPNSSSSTSVSRSGDSDRPSRSHNSFCVSYHPRLQPPLPCNASRKRRYPSWLSRFSITSDISLRMRRLLGSAGTVGGRLDPCSCAALDRAFTPTLQRSTPRKSASSAPYIIHFTA